MIRIVDKNGQNETTVTRGVFENLYKKMGYTIVSPEIVEQIKDAKVIEDKTIVKDEEDKTVVKDEEDKTVVKEKYEKKEK